MAWTEIDRKTDNNDLKEKPHTASLAVSNSECRFIRLTQTSKNHYLDDELWCPAFEFFGTLLEGREPKRKVPPKPTPLAVPLSPGSFQNVDSSSQSSPGPTGITPPKPTPAKASSGPQPIKKVDSASGSSSEPKRAVPVKIESPISLFHPLKPKNQQIQPLMKT
jgi:hypothetical protein